MATKHLENHEHAFLNADNVVEQIAVFAKGAHNDTEIQAFAEAIGFVKAVCCCTHGKPYMGDTWDAENSTWIETAPRVSKEPEIEAEVK
jgi:hypothetical protein